MNVKCEGLKASYFVIPGLVEMISKVAKRAPPPGQPSRPSMASYHGQNLQTVTFQVKVTDMEPSERLYMVGGMVSSHPFSVYMSGFVCSRMSLRMSASHLGIRHGLSQKLCKPCSPCSNEGNEDLGNWEAHRGRELQTLDGVTWSVTLQSKSQIQIEYKYVRISECSGKRYVRWELGENNHKFDSFDMKYSVVLNEAERSFGGLCRMASMKPMEQATELMTKLTELHQRIDDKMSMIQVAVDKRQLSDLNNLHSLVASGVSSNPCNVNDLQPGSCPPGLPKLVALKKKAEDGRAQCIQTFEDAKDRLTELKTEAEEIDVARLNTSLGQHRSKELARLEKDKVLCQQVAGTPDDIKGIDEILKDEEISLAFPEAAKADKYEEVKWQRIQKFCSLGPEVANALVSQGRLPMNLDEIFGVPEKCQSLHQIGKQASQSKKEGEEILKKLKTHSDADLIFKIDLFLYFSKFWPLLS